MAVVTYTKTYTYGTPDVDVEIIVTMRTGNEDLGNGRFAPTNTVGYTLDGVAGTGIEDVRDEDLVRTAADLEVRINKYIDGTPNVEIETALTEDDTYVKAIV